MGIEPTSKAWEAFVLPLNYTRMGAFYANFTAFGNVREILWAVNGACLKSRSTPQMVWPPYGIRRGLALYSLFGTIAFAKRLHK